MFRIATRVLCRKRLSLSSPTCSTTLQKRNTEYEKPNLSTSNFNKNSRVTVIKKYWIFRYIDYIKNYDKILEKNFPQTMRVYRVFSVGTKDLYKDLKEYVQIRKKIRTEGVDALTSGELRLAFTLPKDLMKISPVLLISAIPFTNYIIFPMAIYFPHIILTSHYWSFEQKLKFLLKEQKQRLQHNKPLLRCIQNRVDTVKDSNLKKLFRDNVLGSIGSGIHPTINDILSCKVLFSGPPYSLKKMKRKHVRELLKIHGMSRFGFNHRKRLFERGLLIRQMDTAIQREGVTNLSYDAIQWALSFRGVNPVNMSTDSMQAWLNQWLLISSKVDRDSISLLLHCPILLAYNHVTNWTLLYHDKKKHKN